MPMLLHALVLSLLLSVPTATLAFAFTSELAATTWCVAIVSSLVCSICAFGEACVLCASVNGRVARAAYHPSAPVVRIVEHQLPVAQVLPALPPVREVTRFIPIKSNASYASVPLSHRAKVYAAALESPAALRTETSVPLGSVNIADLREFIAHLVSPGSHARKRWEHYTFVSGRGCDNLYYAELIKPLVDCQAIIGRAPKKSGELVMSPSQILGALGLV